MLSIVSDGVSPLIAALFSSVITLLITYNGNNDYDGPLVALDIKPGAYNLGGCGPDTYSLLI